MSRICIIDDGKTFWLRQWINDGALDHLILTTERKGAMVVSRQEAEDYIVQLKIMDYDAHIDGGHGNGAKGTGH